MNPELFNEVYNKVYDILVKHCGARDTEEARETFVWHHSQEKRLIPSEYRFQGSLRFGGKFWETFTRFYVNQYPEDETPESKEAINAANVELNRLAMEFKGL